MKYAVLETNHSPNQYIYYFQSQTGNVIDNTLPWLDYSSTPLRGGFWLVQGPSDWLHQFLSWPKNLVPLLILWGWYKGDHWQALLNGSKGGEPVRDYIERFHNLFLMCSAGMPLSILFQTCKHNFSTRWKFVWELSKPIHERSLLNNNKRQDTTQSSQAKGKETMAVELSGEALPKQKRSNSNNNP